MADDHQILGICPGAKPAEIRAAYIAALKRLHPDVNGNKIHPQRVSDLVGAYRRLRHVSTRSAQSPPGRRISMRRSRSLSVTAPVRPPASPAFWAKLLSVSLLAAAAAFAWSIPAPERNARKMTAIAAEPTKDELDVAEIIEPSESTVRQAVGALQSFRPQEGARAVEAHSRRCFSELKASPDLNLLDYCLGFDIAATLANAVSSSSQAEGAYFHPSQLADRHGLAIGQLIGDSRNGRARRSRIEFYAVSALADAVSFPDRDFAPR